MAAHRSRRPSTASQTRLALVVEDDATTMRFFEVGLKRLASEGWDLRFARDGAQAMGVLSQEAVDVLVTDLQMPGVDGYQLIAHAHAHYPGMPILVITGLPAMEAHPQALQLGALHVFAKPVRLPQLMETIVEVSRIRPDAFLRGLPLASLLQLLEWEEKSCTLKVREGEIQGHLYIQHGQIVHAERAGIQGPEAARTILRCERPTIEMLETCRVPGSFRLPITRALMEAAVLRDHEANDTPEA